MSATKPPSLAVLSSRLTSATLPSDAIAALRSLLEVVQQSYKSNSNEHGSANARGTGPSPHNPHREPTPAAWELASSASVMGALCTLLGGRPAYLERDHGAGRLVMDGEGGDGDDEGGAGRGAELACELALALLGGSGGDDCQDDGSARVGSGRQRMAKLASAMLTFASSERESSAAGGQFLNAVLDRLCPTEEGATEDGTGTAAGGIGGAAAGLYPRILSLSLLRRLHGLVPHVVQNQLLTAVPDGLNRLIALLGGAPTDASVPSSSSPPEELRNDVLRLLTDLSSRSSNAARLVIFSEGYERALGIAADPPAQGGEGGLCGGSAAIVGDCLDLCTTLTTSVEEMGAEVLLGSGALMDRIGGLLDLRGGARFRNPSLMAREDDERGGRSTAPGGAHEDDDEEEDDLDDILSGGAKAKTSGGGSQTAAKSTRVAIPWLSAAEEEVVERVLSLLAAIVGEEERGGEASTAAQSSRVASRKARIVRHEKTCRFLLDLALFAHPPPNALAYPHGAPSLALQCRALETVALLARGVDEPTLDVLVGRKSIFLRDVSVMERLLYLIVTGGGLVGSPASSGSVDDQILSAQRLSNHALSALRATLRGMSASVMISHALAPPPMEEDDGTVPVPPAEVTKLVNTLVENLHGLSHLPSDVPAEDEMQLIQRGRTVVCAAGAASALSVFLSVTKGETGSMAREMLLGVPLPPPMPPADPSTSPRTLLGCLLGYLETVSSAEDGDNKLRYDSSLTCTLLRFLLEWVGWSFDCISPATKPSSGDNSEEKSPAAATCTMAVVMALLTIPSSVTLGSYAKNPPPRGQAASVKALAAILLGLALDGILSDDKDGESNDKDIGGWTEDSIMTVLTGGKRDLGKFTKLIEAGAKDGGAEGTWILCESERKSFVKSYTHAVRVVRRRVIKQLTAGVDDDAESDDDEGGLNDSQMSGENMGGGKTVMRLLAKQTAELESLRDRLEQAEQLSTDQARQLDRWKRRVESNPTQLDNMLTDISNENDELVRANKLSEVAIKEKDTLIAQLASERDEAATRQAAVVQADPAELSSLKDENSRLRKDVRAANEWMQMATQRMEEMGKRTMELEAAAAAPPPPSATSEADLEKISSLEEENARLRKDVRAANDWMQMASKRMEEMGQKNAELEATAASAAIAGSSKTEDLASLRSELETERIGRETLTAEIQILQARNAEIAEELRVANDRLTFAADTSSNELAALHSDLDTEREKNESLASDILLLQSKNAQLENDLQKASETEMQNNTEGSEDQENEIQQLKTELECVRRELKETAASSSEQSNEQQATIETLQQQVDAQKQELAEMEQHHEVELQKIRDDATAATASEEQLRSQIDTLQRERATEREQAEAAVKVQAAENEVLEAKLNAIRKEAKRGDERAAGASPRELHDEADLQANALASTTAAPSTTNDSVDTEEALASAEFLSLYYQEEIARLSQEHQSYKDEVEASSSLVADGFDAVRIELAKRDEDYAALSNEYQSYKDSIEASSAVAADGVDAVRAELAKRDEEYAALSSEYDAYKESIEASSAVVADGFDAVRIELAKKDEEFVSLEQELQSANARLEEAKGQLQTKEEECATSMEKLSMAETNLSKVREEMSSLEENLAVIEGQSEDVVSEWQARVEELERLVESLEEQIQAQEEEADEAISKWSERCSFLEAEASSAERSEHTSSAQLEEVQSLRSALKNKDNTIEKLRRKVVQVADETAEAVTEKLDGEIKDLRDTVSKLEAENGILVGKNSSLAEETQALKQAREEADTLRNTLGGLKTEMATLQSTLAEKDAERAQIAADSSAGKGEADARIQKLEADVSELNTTIASVTTEKEQLEQKLTTTKAESEADLAEAKAAIDTLKQDIMDMGDQSEAVVAQWEEMVQELEAKLEAANEELQAQQVDAEEAIREWEARCALLEAQGSCQESTLQQKVTNLEAQLKEKDEAFANLQCTLEDQEASSLIAIQKTESSISSLEKQLSEREEEVKTLKEELVDAGEQSENAIEEWQERVQELESSLNDAETLCAEADSAIEQWEVRCDELQAELESLQNQEAEERATTEARIRELEDADCKKQQELEEVGIKLMASQVEAEEVTKKLEAAIESTSLMEKELGDEINALSSQLAEKQLELDKMRREHENEVLSLRRSDEAVRAEERLAMKEVIDSLEADNSRLLEVIGELKEQLRDALDSLQCNATDRISQRATEMAVESLRMEMLNARGLHRSTQPEDEGIPTNPSKQAERNERNERDSLRTALERTKEELIVTKSKLQALEESVASSRVDIVASAQEARAAKSSLVAIRQAFEDQQNRELTSKASLEHQIRSLMASSKNRGNNKEVETLSSEVVQLNAEKERLLQLLSEKEQLISSSSLRDIRDDAGPESTQLTQLRLEKQQLLTKSAEITQRLEQRMREAIAAATSYRETERFVDELRDLPSPPPSPDNASHKERAPRDLSQLLAKPDQEAKLIAASAEAAKLKDENFLLKADLDRSNAEAEKTIRRLKEQCRKYAEAHKLGGSGSSSELAIAGEVSRLRGEMRSEKLLGSMTTAEVLDTVVQLKETIEDERNLYRGLVEEHKDLLALVAQYEEELNAVRGAGST